MYKIINVRFSLSHDYEITKNHIFEVKPSLHYVNKSVNHSWLINFIAKSYITRDRMCVIDCKNLDIFMQKHVITN